MKSRHTLSTAFICLLAISLVGCSRTKRAQKKQAYSSQNNTPGKRQAKGTPGKRKASRDDTGGGGATTYTRPSRKRPSRKDFAGSVNSTQMQTLIKTAESYTGTPYKYGGMSRKGMDCSGLVYMSYKSVDKSVARTSRELSRSGKSVRVSRIRKGDLLFFSANNSKKINHVGLVTNTQNGKITFIHATVSGGVRKDTLSSAYWRKRYRKARRI